MTDYPALKAELDLPAYAGMDDAAICAAMNAPIEVPQDIATADLREVLLASGDWAAVVMLAGKQPSDTLPAQIVGAAILVRDTLMLTTTVRATQPENWARTQAVMAALGPSGAGVVSQASIDRISALRSRTTTRTEQLGFADMTPDELAAARIIDQPAQEP